MTKEMEAAIRTAYRTGDVVIGLSRVRKDLVLGKLKAVVYSSSLPHKRADELENLAKLSEVPITRASFSSVDLGHLCNKPFPIAVIGVKEFGQSDLGAIVKS